MGALAITTEFLIRSLRMATEKLGSGLEGEIDAIQAAYVAAQPGGADRGEPGHPRMSGSADGELAPSSSPSHPRHVPGNVAK